MRKNKILLALLVLTLGACAKPTTPTPPVEEVDHSHDSANFKLEYEEYNSQMTSSGLEYITLNINEENPIQYASYEEVMTLLKEGTGVIYFGFPACPWCRNIVPILLDTAVEEKIDTIYYFNALEYRDERRLNELGKVELVKEAKEGYVELLEVLGDFASVYEGLNDTNIKRLYFPTVVFVKEGQIIALHEGSVDSQLDPFIPLNEEQIEELKKIYKDSFIRTFREVCDEKC